MTTESADDSRETDGGYALTPPTGTAYEWMRRARPAHVDWTLSGRLRAHAVLLGLLGVAGSQQWLASLDGFAATGPIGLVPGLGAVGGAILLATAAALAGCAQYRRRREPMSELQALRALAVEDGATYLGLITGALAVLLAVGGPTLGVGPAVTVGAGQQALVGALAAVATLGAVACWGASRWLDGRVPGA